MLSMDGLDVSGFELDEVEAVHAGMASRPISLRIRRDATERSVQLPRQ